MLLPRHALALACALSLFVAPELGIRADTLHPETSAAFDRYIKSVEERVGSEGGGAFLWIDRLPDRERRQAYEQLKRGEVAVGSARLRGTDDVPHGIVHHWVGTVHIPGVRLARVMSLLQEYDRYAERYHPVVARSRLVSREGNRFDVDYRLRFDRMGRSVVLDASYRIEYRHVDAAHARSHSISTSIREVQNEGKADEVRLPPGQGSGFLWRNNSYCRFEERADGTYEQCEYVALTRNAPRGLGWMLRPIINNLSRGSLEFTLGRTREVALGRNR